MTEGPRIGKLPRLHFYLKASPFLALLCSGALVIVLINYTSLVAVATEVRECAAPVQSEREEGKKERKKEISRNQRRDRRMERVEQEKEGGGEAKGEKKEKRTRSGEWLLRDQPCVRLASGDINTSDVAEATILPFTAGEGDKRVLTKGKRQKAWRGLARLHSPQASGPVFTGSGTS